MRSLFIAALLLANPASAAEEDFDPAAVSVIDAINCYLDTPTYNGFAMATMGDDGLAQKRGWRKVDSGNPFLLEYELPEPIAVTGHYQTRRIAFTSTGILAILDLPDPRPLARQEDIDNAIDPTPLIDAIVASGKATRQEVEAQADFTRFMGERVVADVTEPAETPDGFGTHMTIARSISNVTSHPGKTLYGCSYRMELLDKDGKPL